MDTKSRSEARNHVIHLNYQWQKWESRLNSRLSLWGIMHDSYMPILVEAHAADNCIYNDRRLFTWGANCSQPASGCVLLWHMCERSREEKRRRAAGTNPSATQITSGLSGHIGAQRAWWDMPPRGAKQARWHTDTGAGKERRKEEWRMAHPVLNVQYVPITGI